MNYKALKPCRFSKPYYIGDIIPGEEIAPGMVSALQKRGTITAIDDTKGTEEQTSDKTIAPTNTQPEDDKPEDDKPEDDKKESITNGDGNGKQDGDGESDDAKGKQDGEQDKEDDADDEVKTYTKSALNKMNKPRLLEIAAQMELPVEETFTNAQLLAAILMAQEMKEGE